MMGCPLAPQGVGPASLGSCVSHSCSGCNTLVCDTCHEASHRHSMLDYSSSAQRLLAPSNASRFTEMSSDNLSGSISAAEAVVQGDEDTSPAVEGAGLAAAASNIGVAAPPATNLEADAVAAGTKALLTPAEVDQSTADSGAFGDTSACTGDGCSAAESREMDGHTSHAEVAAQPEALQPLGSELQPAAAAGVDVADSPASEAGSAAAAALKLADDTQQAADETSPDVAEAAEAAVQAAALASPAADSPAAVESGSATAPEQELEEALLADVSQQQQQQAGWEAPELCDLAGGCMSDVQQQVAQLVPAGPARAAVEAAAMTAAAAATAVQVEAPVPPVWPAGVYLTPQMAQLLNEQGELQQLVLALDAPQHALQR